MKYYIVKFHFNGNPDQCQIVKDLLADSVAAYGFESFEDTADGMNGYVQQDLFDETALRQSIDENGLDGVTVTYEFSEAPDEDWNATWEEAGFAPIVVDDTVVIYDARHPESYPAPEGDHIALGIEARQAFGTGTHETTQMIIATLLHENLEDKRVLDCGCGTGILGIAAAKFGAKEVVGYDIDEWSVENAKHNAELNGVKNMEIYHGTASVLNHVCGLFDIVLANINRNVLLQDMKAFKDVLAPDGQIILSGFYEEDIPLLEAEGLKLGLHVVDQKARGDWRCIILS